MHNRDKKKGGKRKANQEELPVKSEPEEIERSNHKYVPTKHNVHGDERVKKLKHDKKNGDFVDGSSSSLHEDVKTKKKRVSWKTEIAESISIQKQPKRKKPKNVITAKERFLSTNKCGLLSLLASAQEQPTHPQKKVDKIETQRALKKAKRKERKLVLREAKTLEKNADTLGKRLKGFQNIVEVNNVIKTEENESVTNDKKMDVKSAIDGYVSAVSRKRARSISPEREVVPGFLYKELSQEQKKTFIRLRDKRRKIVATRPKLILQNSANFSSMSLEDDERTPLTLTDVQHFLIYSLHHHHSTGNIPSWVVLKHATKLSRIVCLVVDGVSLADFVKNENELPVMSAFKCQIDVITPYLYGGDFLTEFLHVPLTPSQRLKLIRRYGSVEEASLYNQAFQSVKKIYPASVFSSKKESKNDKTAKNKETGEPKKDKSLRSAGDAFPRTELLLRSWDLIKERVPVPYAIGGMWANKYKDFVYTKDNYDEVTDDSPIWAIDCEMCQTSFGSELTRISIINEEFEVVYETLVKPYNPIVNYLTQYSGITRKDLADVYTRLEDVHHDVRSLLPSDVILAGHSIGNDLLAMKMFHPYIIDTSTCFNLSGIRHMKTKLKTLMAELLYERIQEGGAKGHDSVEDAASCLKLIKAKLARSIEWGDAVLSGKRSEEESVIAQQILLRKDKEKKEPHIYPTAANSIIRSGPRHHQTVQKSAETPPAPTIPNGPRLTCALGGSSQFSERHSEPFDAEIYSKSIFTHISGRDEKKMLVVGDKKFVKAGKKMVKSTWKPDSPESRVQFSIQNVEEMVSYGCDNAPDNGISIIKLPPPERSGTTLVDVDNWVKKAIQTFKRHNTLFTILFTGKTSPEEDSDENHGLFLMTTLNAMVEPVKMNDIVKACSSK